jgi:hypothetical protein
MVLSLSSCQPSIAPVRRLSKVLRTDVVHCIPVPWTPRSKDAVAPMLNLPHHSANVCVKMAPASAILPMAVISL